MMLYNHLSAEELRALLALKEEIIVLQAKEIKQLRDTIDKITDYHGGTHGQ